MGVLVGKQAPDFCTKAVVNGKIVDQFTLSQFRGRYVIFFFYPLNFTFVCPTEVHAFQERLMDFQERGCEIIGCSVDSHYSHLGWLNVPRSQGGIQGISYPLVSDLNKTIACNYDVLRKEDGIAYRGLFLIDRQGYVRHQIVNDMPLGRSVDEALRMLDALQYFEAHGETCPANWSLGKKGLVPSSAGLRAFFADFPAGCATK
jgi:peroxiredoxin 2/4